ncbi:hypothetical protein E5288_WYG011953 [Bos mutus]|uniref:RNA helicase n=1 Tax=Bos mutus TaxID=72004 RepID=A0A6B0QZC9_9CETA|nr:hypothetical protein [Bos mutus]
MKSTYEQVDLIGKKTQKTAITVEHLAIKCHWTQRAAVIGDQRCHQALGLCASHFKQSDEKLTEKGAVEALAAALAHISGATSVDQHSLINSEAGFVTMILWCSIEMPNISYAWKELKEQLGEDIDSKVKGMVLKESRVFALISLLHR